MGTATIMTKKQKIWLLCLTFTVVGLAASKAMALDPMGPPIVGLDQGQVQFGIDYSRSTMDLELAEGTWIEYLDGAFLGAGEAVSFMLKDFEADRTYANIGFAATDNLKAFVRVGGTKAQFGDSVWQDQEQFESSTDCAFGGGLKASFMPIDDNPALQVGALLQANWAEYNGTLFAPHWFAADRVEIEIKEVQVAVGAAYTWANIFSLYGGPFFHFVSGNFDDTLSEVDPDTGALLTSHYSWKIDEDSIFGAYVGAQLSLSNCSFNIEYQRTPAADAVGVSLLFRN